MNEKLQAALDAVIQEGTFSLSAVEAVKSMRDENAKLLTTVASLTADNERLRAENGLVASAQRIMSAKEDALRLREEGVAKREIEQTKLECLAKQEQAVAAAYKDCFGLVFRNQVVTESVMKNAVIPGVNGCPSYTLPVTDTKTISTS